MLTNCGNAHVCGVNVVSGHGLADLAFASAAAVTDCIPDDGLDKLMVAAGETGELMMT